MFQLRNLITLSACALATASLLTACGGGSSSTPPLTAQTITAVATPASVVAGGTSALSITGGTGTGAVTYAVTTGAASCTVSGSTLTATSTAGSCTVTATKAADTTYAAATSTVSVTVTAAPTVYTFSNGLNTSGVTANGGTWGYYGGGTSNPGQGFANGAFLNGTGGQLAATPADSYVGYYQNLVAADIAGYSYSGDYVGYSSASGLTITGATTLKFGVAINSEWLANTAGAKFVVLLSSVVPGVSTSSCNPQVAAVVNATSTAMTTYTVPLSSFTQVAQNCGTTTVTAAQILAAPVVKLDFQVDGGGAAITASGLTSNSNTAVFTGGTAPNGGTGPYLPVALLINGVIKFQ